jgi:glutathione-specific gamma-glutamylcyclotransferase
MSPSFDADPFCHLPHLQGRLRPVEQSELRVTPEVLAQWDQRARDLGRPAHWRWTESQIEASRRTVLGALDGTRELWVYSYGSLMWDPAFHFAEVRRADLHGWQRRFTYRTLMGRGTPQQPALMLSLEARPGCCQGLAFRIGAAQADAESALLWRREMLRGGYVPRLTTTTTWANCRWTRPPPSSAAPAGCSAATAATWNNWRRSCRCWAFPMPTSTS